MEQFGFVVLKLLVVMAVLLAVWLSMGKRKLGDYTPFDVAVSVTVGTIAGAGIIDPGIGLGETIVAIVLLGMLQIGLSGLSLKVRAIYNKLNYSPTVLVENGQIIKANLRQARMPVEMLLQLLREKDIFDLTEVELAVLEPHGKLSVLKKAEFLPLTAGKLGLSARPNRILLPVLLEGNLRSDILSRKGFTKKDIDSFREQYVRDSREVFIVFMDNERQVHIVKENVREMGMFLH